MPQTEHLSTTVLLSAMLHALHHLEFDEWPACNFHGCTRLVACLSAEGTQPCTADPQDLAGVVDASYQSEDLFIHDYSDISAVVDVVATAQRRTCRWLAQHVTHRSQWSSGSMSDCSARGPGIESRCGQLCLSHNHCDLQPWARAVCTFPAVPRSTQPSTLRGTVNEYQLSG